MTPLAARPVPRAWASLDFAPGLIVFCGGLLLVVTDGGYSPAVWYPAALSLLGLLGLSVALAPPAHGERPRLFGAALAAYAAFCLWSYLSIAWADVPGVAWDGANRTLLYGIVLALVGLRPWRRVEATIAVTIVAIGVATVAAAVLVASALVIDPARLFLEGRLSAPTGYANATAALWLIAFWPALELASGPARRWPVRGVGLAAASLLLETAILSQSRGAAIAFALTALVYLATTRRRWPALLALAAVCALAALAWDPLVAVRALSDAGDIGPTLADARRAIVASAAAAFLVGAAAGLAGPRLAPVVARRAVVRTGRYGLVAVLLAAVVAGTLAIGDPGEWADARWQDFTTGGYQAVEEGESRFSGSLGSNRYDFYRVAVDQFREHPVTGIGADNFAVQYLSERRSPEAPRYPHSLAMRLIAQLGLVGTALFLLFLGLALGSVIAAIRRAPELEAGLSAAALAGFAFWLVHGLSDWLWEFAGLGVLAVALLALAARLAWPASTSARRGGGELQAPPRTAHRRSPWRKAGMVGVALVAAVSLALPAAAAHLERQAYALSSQDPPAAMARLDRAAKLNFLSGEPLAARGILAQRLGIRDAARESLGRALEREPSSWYVELQLGLLDADSGRVGAAVEHMDAAAALNPRQALVPELRRRVIRGEQIDGRAVESKIAAPLQVKLRAVDDSAR